MTAPAIFQRIAVAYDGGRDARAALDQAIDLARALKSELVVLVVAPGGPAIHLAAGVNPWAAAVVREECDAHLKAALTVLRIHDIAGWGEVVGAVAPGALARICRDLGVDLLVSPPQLDNPWTRWRWWTGAAGDIAAGCGCSVLVARQSPVPSHGTSVPLAQLLARTGRT